MYSQPNLALLSEAFLPLLLHQIMAGKVMSGGDLIPVWPDAYGKSKGQEVLPLFRTVPGAVKKDELLYHFLALVDAIRIGGPREAKWRTPS
jgi:hypothetical protein